MPLALGTRSIGNLRGGPASLYIAEGGTIASLSSYGETIDTPTLTTLLADFSLLGHLRQNPELKTTPVGVNKLDSVGTYFEVQHASEVEAILECVEVDNTLANLLLARAEAHTKTDFLWLRTQVIGDYISLLRNVPFTLGLAKPHSWEEIESLTIKVKGRTPNIHDYVGQKLITSPS